MASTSETGHSVNVANFEELISYVEGYGAKYNPVQTAIKLTELQKIHIKAGDSIKKIDDTLQEYTPAVNSRQAVFEPLNKLVTRIISALDSSGASARIVADARTFARKIKGERATPKVVAAAEDASDQSKALITDIKNISASRLSYDNRLANFNSLITLLSKEPLYKPNEIDLQVASLQALAKDMKDKNKAVIKATTPYSNARIARNKTLYSETTGLVDLAFEVKKYVKSIFGAASPEYKQVSKIKFTRPKK